MTFIRTFLRVGVQVRICTLKVSFSRKYRAMLVHDCDKNQFLSFDFIIVPVFLTMMPVWLSY